MAAPINPEPVKNSTWTAWGAIPTNTKSNSLKDVMSEQLALELDHESLISALEPDLPDLMDEIPPHLLLDEGPSASAAEDTSNDLMLAMMLQHEFDTEHDMMLKREQDKKNGTSKVVISYSNHRAVHPAQRNEVDFNPDFLNVREAKIPKDPTPCFNKQGISGKGKNVITKHDSNFNGIRNVIKVMDTFPPEFETGNSLDFDMRIPNNVFNRLKISSNVEAKRGQRHHEKKEHSTQLAAIDEKTKLGLYKLENDGTLDLLNGIISTGKESVVFHAVGGSSKNDSSRRELAIKVYKTTLGKFKNRCEYVKGDMRFIKDDFKKQNPRKIMRIWAEKEDMNLRRMRRFKVPCPESVVLKKNILVMSFVGRGGVAAPKLNNVVLTEQELVSAYRQCVKIIKKMYSECHIVHADLSEFNLLWHEGQVFVIDVSQAVDSIQSKALEFLMRDCLNITKFFNTRGLTDIMSWQELFNDITGMNATGDGQDFLSQIAKRADDEASLRLDISKREFPFDFFFDRSCQEKLKAQEDLDAEAEKDSTERGTDDEEAALDSESDEENE